MKWVGILNMAPLFLVVSLAQNARVETKDVQPVVRFDVLSRSSRVTLQI